MWLEQDVNNVGKAWWLSSIIGIMRLGTPQVNIDRYFSEDTGLPVRSWFSPATDLLPAYYAGVSGGTTIVLIDGSSTLAQMAGYWNACLGDRATTSRDPVNNYLVGAAGTINDKLRLEAIPYQPRTIIAGWSLGGAVAIQLTAKLIGDGAETQPQSITFGAPRSGGISLSSTIGANYSARWMNDDDPVPLFPLPLADAPAMLLIYGLSQTTRLSNYVHVAGGINLAAGGQYNSAMLPSIASVAPVANGANWLFGQDVPGSQGHKIGDYTARLYLAKTASERAGLRDAPVARHEPVAPLASREGNQQAARAASVIFATGAVQNSQPVVIPVERQFKAVRVGRLWFVQWNGTVVACGPTKKRARAFANAGNRVLDVMQRQAVVNPLALSSTLEEYMAIAVDPTTGFTPTMNTVFPT